MKLLPLLLKHWGYGSFRPQQEDIIRSVLSGVDTLALMPTGGGKSICFQLPAIAQEGICLVITPLISLMKDQVKALRDKGISAEMIHSGMHYKEIDIAFDKCVYGQVKLLYLSPERLLSELAIERIKRMQVNLIAVDEAHCISQWGYDFRPPYLKIAEIRKWLPNVPVLAVTATATPQVAEDICAKLNFKTKNIFATSFERKNLIFFAIKDENKLGRLLRLCNKVKGTGIVYVRNRRKTVEIAEFLNKNKIKAEAYHAGLNFTQRQNCQDNWLTGNTTVMVATNAFGMGIDKSNVRYVVHLDIPDSPEAYYQEAGRAGRDGQNAYVVILYHDTDVDQLQKQVSEQYPDLSFIRRIYSALGNHFQIAIGSGQDTVLDLNIQQFADSYNLPPIQVFNALQFLNKEGYIYFSESPALFSKVHIHAEQDYLYKFQVDHSQFDSFIKLLLRSYGGIMSDFVSISEALLAKRSYLSVKQVQDMLLQLQTLDLLTYVKAGNQPQFVFAGVRLHDDHLTFDHEGYALLKKNAEHRMQTMINYLHSQTRCRSQLLLEYFGQKQPVRCGICDVCILRNKVDVNELEFDQIIADIKPLLKASPIKLEDVVASVKHVKEDKVIRAIQWLLDNHKIKYNDANELYWLSN